MPPTTRTTRSTSAQHQSEDKAMPTKVMAGAVRAGVAGHSHITRKRPAAIPKATNEPDSESGNGQDKQDKERLATKRRRANPKAESNSIKAETVNLSTPASSSSSAVATNETGTATYQPTLLPAVLSFPLSSAIEHLQTHDPRFRLFFQHLPCRPFVHLEAIDPFRTLVTSIIGQQVSWMAAKAINARFRALFGFDDEKEGYPSPAMVEKEDVLRLKSVGLSLRKAEYVISLAQHFTTGQLSTELLRDGTDEEISKALIAVRGIGQWTVDMFLMFSLRRPDVLPVGDLGVQKGLLRWALGAHSALPTKAKSTPKKGKKKVQNDVVVDKVEENGKGEISTHIREKTPDGRAGGNLPPTPLTPTTTAPPGTHKAALHTPNMPIDNPRIPPTPASPSLPNEVLEVPAETLPPPATEEMLAPPTDTSHAWDAHRAAPLDEGLSIEVLKARLAGKKVKGGMYLSPREMEVLTEGWRPYRSLGTFYMWPAADES